MSYIYIIPFTFAWYVTISIFVGGVVALLTICFLLSDLGKRRMLSFLGYFLFIDMIVYLGYLSYYNSFSLQTSLPLTFCSLMQLCAAYAAIRRSQIAFEIMIFFGITGPLQAFVTPAVVYTGEEYILVDFFIAHGMTILVPLIMAFCMGFTPTKGAIFRGIALLQIVVGCVYFANIYLGSNYMYLMHKPQIVHPLNSGPHGHNVIVWHLYFYLIAYSINALFTLKKMLGEKTTDKILR
ncbi:MAG: hypothetical protein S4CHLAM27_08390 [Chlamydiia bacterium]|nr:hypothetical protein [Chlamydiia bacterium]